MAKNTTHLRDTERELGRPILERAKAHYATLDANSRQAKLLLLAMETFTEILANINTEFTTSQWREFSGAKTLIEKSIPAQPRGAAIDPENASLNTLIDALMKDSIRKIQSQLITASTKKQYILVVTADGMRSKVSTIRERKNNK